MIKVLNIMTSNLDYNGIGMSLLNYYKNIDKNIIQMDYLVPNEVKQKLKDEFTINGNNLFEFKYKKGKMHQRNPILYCVKLFKVLKKEKYDIVHAHGSSSMLFLQLLTAKIAGVKIRIAHSHNTCSDYNFLNKLCKPLFKRSYTEVFACGKEAGEWLFGKDKKVRIIPNGINYEKFEFNLSLRNEYRQKYNIENKKVIGHVGNFNYQKNHEFLIKIFYELTKLDDNYFLVLVGKGALEKQIHELVTKFKIDDKVLFLGQISIDDVSKWLNAMDIMVFPSRFEGFPNVLIEWQTSGLQCIISDKITKDVKITDLVRFKSIEEEPKEWAKVIGSIKLNNRENKDNIKNIIDAGYDIKRNAKDLEKIYIELVSNIEKI